MPLLTPPCFISFVADCAQGGLSKLHRQWKSYIYFILSFNVPEGERKKERKKTLFIFPAVDMNRW